MSTTFTLKINDLRVIQLTNQPNTVCQIDYEYVGLSSDNRAHSYLGTERLDTDDIDSFVVFDDLTEATVVDWLEAVWSDTHYTHMQDQINARLDAPIISSSRAPWLPDSTLEGSASP